jgi:hypothetical protein
VAAFLPNRYNETRAETHLEKLSTYCLRGGIGRLRIIARTAIAEWRDVPASE